MNRVWDTRRGVKKKVKVSFSSRSNYLVHRRRNRARKNNRCFQTLLWPSSATVLICLPFFGRLKRTIIFDVARLQHSIRGDPHCARWTLYDCLRFRVENKKTKKKKNCNHRLMKRAKRVRFHCREGGKLWLMELRGGIVKLEIILKLFHFLDWSVYIYICI